MTNINKEKYSSVFIFLSAFLWSLSGIYTKSTEWNGICLAVLRGIIAFSASAPLLRNGKPHLNRVKVLCAICYFLQGILFMVANKYTTAGNATVLQNMSPLYIIILNALIHKKAPSKLEIIVCIILFVGISLAFAGNFGGGAMIGNLCAMLSALFYAGVYFFSKQDGANPLESLLIGNAFYLFLLPLLFTNHTVLHTNLQTWAFLIFFGFLSCFGAWYCFTIGIQYTSSLQASFIALAEPVMAPLWTFLFLHEKISRLSLAGFVIVIITLIIYNIKLSSQPQNTRQQAC